MRIVLAGLIVSGMSGALVSMPSPIPSVTVREAPSPAPAEPLQQSPMCCCRVYNQRWQFSWMAPASCQQSNGSCVAPDNC